MKAGRLLAIKDALSKARLGIKDIDVFEVCEAFAVQAIYTQKKLKISKDKMNVWGGDISLGHPLGAAGARILVTLLHVLEDKQKRFGVACICLGGGGSIAMVVENLK